MTPPQPTLTFGHGDYSCAACGFGMGKPCEHWETFLRTSQELLTMTQPKGAAQAAEEWTKVKCDLCNKGAAIRTVGTADRIGHLVGVGYFMPCLRIEAYATSRREREQAIPTPTMIQRLLVMRDALITKDYDEAYNQLYWLADRDRNTRTPWDEWERGASAVPSPAPEWEKQAQLDDALQANAVLRDVLGTLRTEYGLKERLEGVPSPAATPYTEHYKTRLERSVEHAAESPVPSEAAPEAIVEPWMRGKAKSYLAEWSARYRTHRELAKVEWDGAQLEYHLANFLARNREAAQPSEAVSDNELIALADEIERTAFFREIDVMETDISALKRAIANLVRSKVSKREAVSSTAAPPNIYDLRDSRRLDPPPEPRPPIRNPKIEAMCGDASTAASDANDIVCTKCGKSFSMAVNGVCITCDGDNILDAQRRTCAY